MRRSILGSSHFFLWSKSNRAAYFALLNRGPRQLCCLHARMAAPAAGKKRSRAEERDRLIASKRDAEDDRIEALVFGADVAARDVKSLASGGASSRKAAPAAPAAAAAWHDDDDDAVGVDLAAVSRTRKLRETEAEEVVAGPDYVRRLRAQFAKRAAASQTEHAWAQPRGAGGDADDGDDADGAHSETGGDDLRPAVAGGLLQAPVALLPGRLNVSRVRDANRAEPSKAVVQALGWHHGGGVMFTAGLDKTLRFFAVDGRRNPKVASAHFDDLPIASAAWTGDGAEVIVTGRRPFFYAYDVEAGAAQRVPRIPGVDDRSLESALVSPPWLAGPGLIAILCAGGYVALLSSRTKQVVGGVKTGAGTVRAAAWSCAPGNPSAPELLTTGDAGDVFRWDLRTMACSGRLADEGSTGGTALAATRDGTRWAVGSRMGVVNVYDAAAVAAGGPTHLGASDAAALAASGAVSVRSLFAGGGAGGTRGASAPLHTSLALTTGVDTLAFNDDGALLVMASKRVPDALRVLHVGAGTAFSNWPTARTPLHAVSTAAFSPHSGYLSVGNDRGRVLLYRLNHYAEA